MDAQQIQDQLKVAKAEATALAGDAAIELETETTVRKVLEKLATEMQGDGKAILEGILKISAFEDTTTIKIKVENDPLKQTQTSTTGTIQALGAAKGDSAVASNLSAVGKKIEDATAELAKMVETGDGTGIVAVREAIAKAGPATAKLDQIKQVFAIKFDAGEDDDWRVRSKVGELVSMLMQHAALERMMESSPAPSAAAKAAGGKQETADAWPQDMAGVPFDAKSGRFTKGDPPWGRDPSEQS
jgi:hypothetical protein